MCRKYRQEKKATHLYTYYTRNRAEERKEIPPIRQPQKKMRIYPMDI